MNHTPVLAAGFSEVSMNMDMVDGVGTEVREFAHPCNIKVETHQRFTTPSVQHILVIQISICLSQPMNKF